MTEDPLVQQFREQIWANDRAIIAGINRRLTLVARLKWYKEEHGIPLFDPDREEKLVQTALWENRGPLSRQELERAYRDLLALTKREIFENGDRPG